MPLNTTTKKFTRAFAFVDEFAIGDEVTREALDQALDDLAGGINGIVALGYQEVGEWSAASGAFPTTRPDLTAIQAKDAWRVTAAGTVGGQAFVAGDFLVALRAGGGVTYTSNWLRVTGSVATFQSLANRAELAAAQSESAKNIALGAATTATEAAEDAEASAAILGALAERADIGPFVSDGAIVDFNLPFDPVNHKYVELFIGNGRAWLNDDFTVIVKDDSPSGYGIRLSAVWPPGVVIRGSLVRPAQPGEEIESDSPILTLRDFGIDDDGTGDQGPGIQAAIEAAAGRKLQGSAGAIYRIETPVEYVGNIDLDLSMSRVVAPANITPFVFKAPAVGPFAVSADYDLAGAPLAIAMQVLPFAPKAGQVVWISSRARDPGDRDNGSSSQQYRVGEAFRLGAGSTTTSLVLQAPLAHSEGIEPTSTAGNEARIPAYTVAMDTLISLPDMAAQCAVKLPVIEFEDGHDADDWNASSVSIWAYVNPRIEAGGTSRGYGAGVRLWGTFGATVNLLSVSNLTDDTPNGQFGYGVADGGWNTRVLGLTSHNVRHAYTTSKSTSSYSVGTFDAYKVLTFGRTAGAQIVGGIASGGVSAVWDTHHDAQDILFSGNTSDGCGSAGYSIRGRNISIVNPVIRNCNEGIRYFTEYESGDPDDDIYNNGKLLSDFTSGLIDSPQMDVRDNCLDVRAATVVLSGAGRYRSQSACLIYNAGGTLAVGGTHRFLVEGARVPADGTALIDLGANNAFSASAFPEPNIVIDGVVEIDARLWTGAALTAISADGGTKVIVRGILRLLMPAGSVFMSGGGTILCEGAGEIQWSSAGTPGLPAGISGLVVRVVADDGAVYDGVNQSTFFGATERVRPTGNGVTFFANGGGIRIEDTDTAVSDAEDAGSIVFGTNDASNPAFDAAQILARGNGSLGYTDTAFRRNNGGGLRDAIVVRSNGDVDFLRDDGTTIGAQWDASTGLFLQAGVALAVTPETFGAVGNGITDDTAAFQAFFAWFGTARVAGPTGARIPPRRYLLSNRITCTANTGFRSWLDWDGAEFICDFDRAPDKYEFFLFGNPANWSDYQAAIDIRGRAFFTRGANCTYPPVAVRAPAWAQSTLAGTNAGSWGNTIVDLIGAQNVECSDWTIYSGGYSFPYLSTTGTLYRQTGTNLVRVSGAVDFPTSCVGKTIEITAGSDSRKTRITARLSATSVTVENSATDTVDQTVYFGSPAVTTTSGSATVTLDGAVTSDMVGLLVGIPFAGANQRILWATVTAVNTGARTLTLDKTAGQTLNPVANPLTQTTEIATPAVALRSDKITDGGLFTNGISQVRFNNLQIEAYRGVALGIDDAEFLHFIQAKCHGISGPTGSIYSCAHIWGNQVGGSWIGEFDQRTMGRWKTVFARQTQAFTFLSLTARTRNNELLLGIGPNVSGFPGAEVNFDNLTLIGIDSATFASLVDDRTSTGGYFPPSRFFVPDGDLSVAALNRQVSADNTGALTINSLVMPAPSTFTPVVADASSGGNVATVGSSNGIWQRIGNIVFFSLRIIDINTTGLTAGNTLYVRGLPVALRGGQFNMFNGALRINGMTFALPPTAFADDGGTYIIFYQPVSGASETIMTVASLASGTADLHISGNYFA